MHVTAFDLAQRFVGVREVPGQQDDPRVLAMLRLDANWPEHDEVPWCSAFTNYVAWLLRLPRSKSLRARSWLGVGTPVTEPRIGWDIAVLWRGSPDSPSGHVGFYAGHDGDQVLLLGGNQGDAVSVAPFPSERLLGFRRLRHEN